MIGVRQFDRFRLTPAASKLRAKGGWGVVEGSKIKRFLDGAEAAGPPGTILNRADFPTLTDVYAYWLKKVGYLEPVED